MYFDPGPTVRKRLEALMGLPPVAWAGDNQEHLHAAWPAAVLVDGDGQSHGFLMPLIGGTPANMLFDGRRRLDVLDAPTWRTLITAAARIARMFAMLHQAGIVIGDVSPTNIIVSRSGHVTLIDCDTVQFVDPVTKQRYPHTKQTPEYSPPESAGGQILEPSHDTFGLAIMTCQLLMNGQHPFEGVPSGPSMDTDLTQDNIRLQNNRITHPERLIAVAGSLPPAVLPPRVLELAQSAFGDGHTDPRKRPSAAAWAAALDRAGFELMGCQFNEHHLYHRSLSACIWCTQIAAGFADPYPAARQPARQAVGPGVTTVGAGTRVTTSGPAYPLPPAQSRPVPPGPGTARATPPTGITSVPPKQVPAKGGSGVNAGLIVVALIAILMIIIIAAVV